jgi:dTDP-4-amino-4,6-dideoxygalactose transaminase
LGRRNAQSAEAPYLEDQGKKIVQNEPIQLFVPNFRVDECLEQIRETLERGWTGLGYKTIELEDAWKAATGVPHAHFLNSATAGLHLAVRLLKQEGGWSDGDEIISTPITFVSTNHAILYENMKVVFADIDQYGCLDPESVAAKITPRTRAVIFVGLGGNTGQLEAMKRLCDERGLKLILDAAHMAGTRCKGVTPGLDTDVIVYSFQAVKNLPTADSGMICFKEASLDKLVRQQSWLGIDKDTYSRTLGGGAYKWHYDVPSLGFKHHGNSVVAAIGLVQLKYLDADNAYRRQIARWYDEFLQDVPVARVPMAEGCEPSRHLYQVLVNNRDEVLLALNSLGVFPGVHYRDNTDFTMYKDQQGLCPRAAEFSSKVLSLPLHMKMSFNDAKRVCSALASVISS